MRYILIAGEEGGPASNKMGGIWEVINAEALTLASLSSSGSIPETKVAVLGPYYPHKGADWNMNLQRVTDLRELDKAEDSELNEIASELEELYDVKVAKANDKEIFYVLFDTSTCSRKQGKSGMSISDEIKKEAWELAGLDSLRFESEAYGREYTHYLELSHAISSFTLLLSRKNKVALHLHEFGVFYAAARLSALRAKVNTVATFHATLPGRSWGSEVINKIKQNDAAQHPYSRAGLIALEALAKHASRVTFVGNYTRQEGVLFYGINGIIIRNGITVEQRGVNWEKKSKARKKLQEFIARNIYEHYDGKKIEPDHVLPFFTISRMEIENKGYPDLLDAIVDYDRILNNYIDIGEVEEDTIAVFILITSQCPKIREKLPKGFPIYLPEEILVGEEIRLKNLIYERNVHVRDLISGRRRAIAVLYPQWIGKNDGGLNMSLDEVASGCIAGVFPSRYDPFLLTGLEAAREGTPIVVSRVCGFSDAVLDYEIIKGFAGGVMLVDNVKEPYNETVLDYALAIHSIAKAYLRDRGKYKLMCAGAFQLAKDMGWEEPVKRYHELLFPSSAADQKV